MPFFAQLLFKIHLFSSEKTKTTGSEGALNLAGYFSLTIWVPYLPSFSWKTLVIVLVIIRLTQL